MNLIEYKKVALARLNKTITDDPNESMNYSCMGLIEETGEIIAELRKPLFKGNFHEKVLDIPSIKSELGDLIWYIALMCRNHNINIEELENFKMDKDNVQLLKREEIIRVAIIMGKYTGQIVEKSNKLYKNNNNYQELVDIMREQYKNINYLAELLGIDIEEILEENVKKINSRYNDKGDVNR